MWESETKLRDLPIYSDLHKLFIGSVRHPCVVVILLLRDRENKNIPGRGNKGSPPYQSKMFRQKKVMKFSLRSSHLILFNAAFPSATFHWYNQLIGSQLPFVQRCQEKPEKVRENKQVSYCVCAMFPFPSLFPSYWLFMLRKCVDWNCIRFSFFPSEV